MNTNELTNDQITDIWEAMPGQPGGWLKEFGYIQFARAIEERLNDNRTAPVPPLTAPAPLTLPEGWIPLSIVYNDDMEYPEEVAYGPERMMNRLGKWLDKFLAQEIAMRDGMVLAPNFRGYAHLGIGAYVLNHSAAGEAPELSISIATEAQKTGRTVGDLRDNEPGELVQPEDITVCLRFENVAGLDALEQQLRLVRSVHFPESVAKAAPAAPVQTAETEISDRLRQRAAGAMANQDDAKLMLTAADECDRFYNGMVNWKTNAQAKDRTIIELRDAAKAAPVQAEQAQAEPNELRIEIQDGGSGSWPIGVRDAEGDLIARFSYKADAARFAALPAQAEQAAEVRAAEWISVDERLPEVGQLVMVYSPPTKYDHPGEINIAFDCIDPNDDDHASWLNHNEHYEHFCCVAKPEGSVGPSAEAPYTHWVPLPAAPSTATSNDTAALGDTGGDK